MRKAFQQILYLCKHPTFDIRIREGGTKCACVYFHMNVYGVKIIVLFVIMFVYTCVCVLGSCEAYDQCRA